MTDDRKMPHAGGAHSTGEAVSAEEALRRDLERRRKAREMDPWAKAIEQKNTGSRRKGRR